MANAIINNGSFISNRINDTLHSITVYSDENLNIGDYVQYHATKSANQYLNGYDGNEYFACRNSIIDSNTSVSVTDANVYTVIENPLSVIHHRYLISDLLNFESVGMYSAFKYDETHIVISGGYFASGATTGCKICIFEVTATGELNQVSAFSIDDQNGQFFVIGRNIIKIGFTGKYWESGTFINQYVLDESFNCIGRYSYTFDMTRERASEIIACGSPVSNTLYMFNIPDSNGGMLYAQVNIPENTGNVTVEYKTVDNFKVNKAYVSDGMVYASGTGVSDSDSTSFYCIQINPSNGNITKTSKVPRQYYVSTINASQVFDEMIYAVVNDVSGRRITSLFSLIDLANNVIGPNSPLNYGSYDYNPELFINGIILHRYLIIRYHDSRTDVIYAIDLRKVKKVDLSNPLIGQIVKCNDDGSYQMLIL